MPSMFRLARALVRRTGGRPTRGRGAGGMSFRRRRRITRRLVRRRALVMGKARVVRGRVRPRRYQRGRFATGRRRGRR